MDLEARNLRPSLKAKLLAKIRKCISDPNILKRGRFEKYEELLEAAMDVAHEASANQGESLAVSTKRLNQSTDILRETRQAPLEMNELEVPMLEDLQHQCETPLHSHKKLSDVGSLVAKIKKVLGSLSKRVARSKTIVGWIIFVGIVCC